MRPRIAWRRSRQCCAGQPRDVTSFGWRDLPRLDPSFLPSMLDPIRACKPPCHPCYVTIKTLSDSRGILWRNATMQRSLAQRLASRRSPTCDCGALLRGTAQRRRAHWAHWTPRQRRWVRRAQVPRLRLPGDKAGLCRIRVAVVHVLGTPLPLAATRQAASG